MGWWRRKAQGLSLGARETIFKVCVLGDAKSRKSELLRPLVYSMMDDKYITTIGAKVTKKSITYARRAGDREVPIRATFLLWDILGQKEYARLNPVYIQGAVGALVLAAADAPNALESMALWARSFHDVVGPRPIAFLLRVPTLSDATVPEESAALVAQFPGSWFALVSLEDPATTGAAIMRIGEQLVDEYLTRHPLPRGPSAAP